ncbi:RNA polymerase III subunit RPC82-related, helix-turn-helix [Cynara cardunculus var. scolymus]|uniref:DNA-directed RNA polymerase III subunit RPC3 n=1 Tax=Cynara cardunculus var. scolymus TaxID=59895 RepID=A0A118K2Q0_CYNCS|nr:RNA polymerase III subunit RPC82-related, helix-turn-helix [Cynara cardunculus var. scolymus]
MVSPHGIKLAVHLISTYFGDIVSKVCECLLCKGTLSLAQVIRYTELGGFGEAPKIVTQYMALHDNIIHHMRFPKFLAIVSDEFGQECMELFEGLLQHGRLSFNQIMDRHKDKHRAVVTSGG